MNHTLRLYRNPLKQSLNLVLSLGGVAVGLLLLRDTQFSASAASVVLAYLCIGFFGLGWVVFLYSMVRDLLLRRPVLQVDAQGWTYSPPLGRHPQYVPWRAIGRVAIYRQRYSWKWLYYLVLEARDSGDVPPSLGHAITASLYPSMTRAAITIALNMVLIRMSPANAEHLLQRLQQEFPDELFRHGIAVSDRIQDM